MAKQAAPSQAAVEGFAVQRPSKAAAGLLRLLGVAVSKPNRNSLWGLGRGTMAKQAGHLRKLLRRVLRFKGLRKLLRGF